MILGVCSWLETRINIDVTIIRVAFIVLTVLGGSGVLLYLILWLLKMLSR